MISVVSLLIVLALSMLVIRIGAVAFLMTGLSEEVAQFQALSAFSGAGFTTGEAENIVKHPARRRIASLLIRLGSVGVVSSIATLLLSFVGAGQATPERLLVLVLGIFVLLGPARSRIFNRMLTPLIERLLARYTTLDLRDYAALLHLREDYRIVEIEIGEYTWLANHTIGELNLGEEGMLVLGVKRSDEDYIGAPPNELCLRPGDLLVLYGRKHRLDELSTRALSNQAAHREAKAEHKRLKGSSSSYSSTASSSKGIWCANARWVVYTDKHSCDKWKAKAFATKYQAQAEHKRLKAASTPAIKTASLTVRSNVKDDKVYVDNQFKGSTRLDLDLPKGRHTIRIEKNGYETYEETIYLTDNLIIRGNLEKVVEQTTSVDKSALDLEFWQSVKGSDDPDMFREYLRQFPQGVYAGLAKLKVKKLGGTTTSVAQSSIPKLNYGDYYALVIGNNRYEHFRNLRTAVNDARTVSNLLKNDYGFEVTLLEDATRSQILDSIINLKNRVSRNDNVVVYYAGHGQLDPDTDEGFWIPVDADPDSQSNWLLTDRVRSQIKAMPAKHVMVVADSCFSGKFTRSAITRGLKIEPRSSEYVPALQRLIEKKSRTALTSGGLEPVLDSGSGGGHSVFAEVFISILNDNEGVLDAAGLFSQLRTKVINNSDQTPEYSTIHQGGHDGGDFLFVRQ